MTSWETQPAGPARGLAFLAGQAAGQRTLLAALVNADSPSDQPAAVNQVGAMLREQLAALGLPATVHPEERHGNHIVAETPGLPPQVLLMGHFDTVYPLGTAAQRPYREEGDRAYGPGVGDMKGGLVCILYAVRALLQSGRPLRAGVRIFFNSDEEPGSPVSRRLLPEVTRGIAWAVLAEPSEPAGHLCVQRKGVGIFRFHVTGRAAHAGANPGDGVNAVVQAADLALRTAALADPGRGTTVNPGVIHGGSQPYVVPDAAELALDVRVAEAAERSRIEGALAEMTAHPTVSGAAIRLVGSFHRPPMEIGAGTRDLMARVEAAAAALGQSVAFAPSGGASDGNLLVAAGVPTVDGIGPVGGGYHTPQEYVEIDSLLRRTQLIYLLLARALLA